LYRQANKPKKALKILKDIYKQTSKIEILGQIAILEFEIANDKKKVLDKVVKKLKNVISVLDNHYFQNFLGYILIDYELDVEDGVKLIQKALKKQPNNIAYLDSIAWGYYKKHNCKKAYKYMKKVIDEVGLSDSEIKLHWDKIKGCR
jgi:predicted Zn-dependent protease